MTEEKPEPKYMTSGQVADKMGAARDSVNRWANKGELKSTRTPGGHRRFLRADIEQVLAEREALSDN